MSDTGSAQHYLPADGAVLTFPMLQFSLLGALCMLGTLWLVWRARGRRCGRRAGHRRPVAVRLVAAVDADHPGRHHAAVLPAATHADRAALGGRGVRLHRGGAGDRRPDQPHGDPGGRGDRADRCHRVQPGHPRRPAPRPDGRLHRHRRQRPARRPPTARRREVLPGGRRRHPAGHRQAPRADRRADRRLQLPVLLPLLRLPGPDVALRQPPCRVRQARRGHRVLGRPEDLRPVGQGPRHAALAGADGVSDAPGGAAGSSDTYTLRLAEDVYPNQPNVRRYAVEFDANLFTGPHFTVKTIGPFVLAIRNP